MHEHYGCRHELKHCEICDVIYCEKCGKEWGTHNHYHAKWIWNPYEVTISPYTTPVKSPWDYGTINVSYSDNVMNMASYVE